MFPGDAGALHGARSGSNKEDAENEEDQRTLKKTGVKRDKNEENRLALESLLVSRLAVRLGSAEGECEELGGHLPNGAADTRTARTTARNTENDDDDDDDDAGRRHRTSSLSSAWGVS